MMEARLDQRLFVLDASQWEAFTEALNAPVTANPAFKALMDRKAP